tara:strand:+ start:43 stop:231 length:189 start_codon:yes stop_codon:yes gene_type:complete
MEDEKLTSFQESELKYLRQQVDNLQDKENSREKYFNLQHDLWVAREELDRFVKNLRAEGKNI